MAVNSKQKGCRFERELAAMLRDEGYDCKRGQQFCGLDGNADVVGLDGVWIEAKHQEKLHPYEWMEQAKRDAKTRNEMPVVFFKKNYHEVLVQMQFETFMKFYRAWENDNEQFNKHNDIG